MTHPEPKSPTEQLDIKQKTEELWSGRRPVDRNYPYVPPDYEIPFLHIGTEKQIFLDNFILYKSVIFFMEKITHIDKHE